MTGEEREKERGVKWYSGRRVRGDSHRFSSHLDWKGGWKKRKEAEKSGWKDRLKTRERGMKWYKGRKGKIVQVN